MITTKSCTAFLLLLLASIASFTIAEPKIGADNVCNETVTVRKDKFVTVPVRYELKIASMCGILPCTKVRHETRYDSQLQTTYQEVAKQTCCAGYAETPDRRCEPICLKSCQNGKCVRPNICECHVLPTYKSPGFAGSTCSRFVCLNENLRWGQQCEKECNCPSTAYCSASTGKCICRPGWRGANCSEECDPSSNCQEVELPPILEPEANVIDDNLAIRSSSQRLVAGNSQARSMFGEDSNDHDEIHKPVSNIVATFTIINLFCMLITCILVFSLFWYKKRLTQLKNTIYDYYSSSGSSFGSDRGGDNASHLYSTISMDGNNSRPRMPTPQESNYLSKNLNFAAATRNILNPASEKEQAASQADDFRKKLVFSPQVESSLIASHQSAQQNVYSDIEPSRMIAAKPAEEPPMLPVVSAGRVSDLLARECQKSRLNLIAEENEYQVPKSSALRVSSLNLSGCSSSSSSAIPNNNQAQISDEQSIYEEIKLTK